jgi:hypothetical protein
LDDHVAFIFRVEEYAKQETSMKFVASIGWLSVDYMALYPRRQSSSLPPL